MVRFPAEVGEGGADDCLEDGADPAFCRPGPDRPFCFFAPATLYPVSAKYCLNCVRVGTPPFLFIWRATARVR